MEEHHINWWWRVPDIQVAGRTLLMRRAGFAEQLVCLAVVCAKPAGIVVFQAEVIFDIVFDEGLREASVLIIIIFAYACPGDSATKAVPDIPCFSLFMGRISCRLIC